MTELEAIAKVALANTFVMYFKAHSYHWNVVGKDFVQHHGFLGDLYEELHGAVDPMAEEIRACGYFAPKSLEEMYTYKTVTEDQMKPVTAMQMFMNLIAANEQVIDSLNKLFAAATAENKQGFADFVASRIDAHAKHGWMLNAIATPGE